MHFLTQIVEGYNATPKLLTMALATSTPTATTTATQGVPDMAKMISEFGIQVVISAIMMLIMWRLLNNLIKRDNKLFDELSPKVAELEKLIKDMDSSISSQVSTHNAHSNQLLHALEKDQDDIRSLLLESQDQLRNISGQLTILTSKMEVLAHLMSMTQYGGLRPPISSQAPSTYRSPDDITEVFNGDVDHYDIHPGDGEHTKKENS